MGRGALEAVKAAAAKAKLYSVFGTVTDDDYHTLDRVLAVRALNKAHARQIVKGHPEHKTMKSLGVQDYDPLDDELAGSDLRKVNGLKLGGVHLLDEGT